MVATTAPLGPGLLIFAFPDWIRTWELVIPVAWLILEYAFVLVLWPTLPRMCDPVLRADEDTLLLSHSLRAAPVELKWSDVSAVFPLWNWGELYLGVEPASCVKQINLARLIGQSLQHRSTGPGIHTCLRRQAHRRSVASFQQ